MDCQDALRDSLRRQIAETKKQITAFSQIRKKKDLEMRRALDLAKEKVVVNFLKLKKEVKDLRGKVEDFSRECNLDYHEREQVIMVISN
jgi:hypothetical protein